MTLLPFLFPPPLNCLSMQTMFYFFTLLIVLLTSLPSTLTCRQSLFGCHKNHYVSTSQSLNTCFFSFRAQSTFNNFFVSISGSALKEFVLTSISVYFLHLASSPGSLAHSCGGEAPLPPWEWARMPGDEAILTPTLSWTLHINLISLL